MLLVYACDFLCLNGCVLGSRVLSVLAQAASKLVLWRGSFRAVAVGGRFGGVTKTSSRAAGARIECGRIRTNGLVVGHDGQIYCNEGIGDVKRECKILRYGVRDRQKVRLG